MPKILRYFMKKERKNLECVKIFRIFATENEKHTWYG